MIQSERDRHVGPGRRGGRRRGRAAARQDRHDHAGQSPGRRSSSPRLASASATWPTPPSLPRWPTKRPRAAASSCWPRRSTGSAERDVHEARRHLHAVHGPDADERRQPGRPPDSQGRRRCDREPTCGRPGGTVPAEVRMAVDDDRQGRRHAAGGRRRRSRARRDSSQGHRQGRHQGALRRAAADGHQDRDDHRRQSADRRRHRRRGRRRRFPGPGHAGSQAQADPRLPGRGATGRHDRRRHQRRAGAGPGRRGGGHEHRHPGRQGSRQHGRSRFESDQAASRSSRSASSC